MGGCVSSLIELRGNQSLHDHSIIGGYLGYGTEADAVPGTEKPGYSAVYRIAQSGDAGEEPLRNDPADDLVWLKKVEQRVLQSANKPAMGYRTVERVEKRSVTDPVSGQTKVFNYYYCAPSKFITYKEMWDSMNSFGRGLVKLGLKRGDNVSIYEETRWEWMVSIYGIWLQRMAASTVYANLGKDALRYALCEIRSEAIVCNGSEVGMLAALLEQEKLNPLVIALDEVPAGTDVRNLRVVAWWDVIEQGRATAASPAPVMDITVASDDVCLIMYTSGTTGNPKGVMHTHGSITAGCKALHKRVLDLYRPQNEEEEMYCAYLPLAHILEFAVVNIFLERGTIVGFGRPRTLTDTHTIPHGDLSEFKPQVILSVPRIFDTIRKAVEERLPPPGSLRRDLFSRAYAFRRAALLEGKDTPYWNERVFSGPRNILGGCVYGMLSGGGPLSESTQEFINVVCGGPLLIQGWGLTETVCCGATQRLGDLEPNCVGQLVETCEARLKDVEDYKHTDTPEPRGEICLRGPFLFKGYYKQPELTKEAFDEDGWFHTGDVGSITRDGKLRIVGRVKALAKNCLGEYIALEALEAVYSSNDLVLPNGVCVVVHPDKPYICALCLTDEKRALKFAAEKGIDVKQVDERDGTRSVDVLLRDPVFQKAAADALALTGKAAGRQSFELVKRVHVMLDEWTPENGLMTPTLKLRRTNIEAHYAKAITKLFEE